jgi:pimeloyl-ACP methyl ester carboxylesterase
MTLHGLPCVHGQGEPAQRPTPTRKEPPLKFEEVSLTSRDGVNIRATYYPGPESKQTACMILVHDWGESRGAWHEVAQWMQRNLRLTVIAPDLRGHGNSTTYLDQPIDADKLRGPALAAMLLDIEACKSHLLKQNNEGKLNIEQLGVTGSGFGAILALKWAVGDWMVRDLPNLKQGRDVKALIMVSPVRAFRGCHANDELKNLQVLGQISSLVLVGQEDRRRTSDAQSMHKIFERAWGDQAKLAAPFFAAETSLQGIELIKAPGTGVDRWLAPFIQMRLIQLGERFPWTDRTSPLQ